MTVELSALVRHPYHSPQGSGNIVEGAERLSKLEDSWEYMK